jgi:hypothetical protein
MVAKAGEVHSIRLPSGAAKELKELTGRSVSTVARQQILAVIAAAKMKAQQEQQA